MFTIRDNVKTCVFAGAVLLATLVSIDNAQAAQSESVLYYFCSQNNCSDGASPISGLISDASGNLYGTAYSGGGNCGCGVVFKIAPDGTETVLYTFGGGAHGAFPIGSLIMDKKGNLYGVADGGTNKDGIIFEISPNGTQSVLYTFVGGSDGANPSGALIADKKGNLYGMTTAGGAHSDGTVFKLTPSGSETVLYSFAGGSDGIDPVGSLIADKNGNFFGATGFGGPNGEGTVFKLATNGTESVLYAFTGGADGGQPYAGVVADKAGNLYGTTYYGGIGGFSGVVYKVAPNGTETVLHAFCSLENCDDGYLPEAGLIIDKKGNLYGTTSQGGGFNPGGDGTVFKVSPSGKETVLHAFDFQAGDGVFPNTALLLANGYFYGATTNGGADSVGTVYKLKE
jgi:uncharacterized repeat protein (TIGR03803 family)